MQSRKMDRSPQQIMKRRAPNMKSNIKALVTRTDPEKFNKEQHRSLLSMAPGKVTIHPKHGASICLPQEPLRRTVAMSQAAWV